MKRALCLALALTGQTLQAQAASVRGSIEGDVYDPGRQTHSVVRAAGALVSAAAWKADALAAIRKLCHDADRQHRAISLAENALLDTIGLHKEGQSDVLLERYDSTHRAGYLATEAVRFRLLAFFDRYNVRNVEADINGHFILRGLPSGDIYLGASIGGGEETTMWLRMVKVMPGQMVRVDLNDPYSPMLSGGCPSGSPENW